MLVYLSTRESFHEDVLSGGIDDIIHDKMKQKLKLSASPSEIRSWRQSLQHIDSIINDFEIPANCGVGIETQIPNTDKRIDFVISGEDENGTSNAIVIELKQWEEAYPTEKPDVVKTYLGGRVRETSHPSYQAWSYAALLKDFNETVYEENIQLKPCAYLHNYIGGGILESDVHQAYLEEAPAFAKADGKELQDFIKEHVRKGDNGNILYQIDNGTIKPSKHLIDSLNSMMEGNREFIMIDEQKVAFENVLYYVNQASESDKHVLIIEGGPGTGKSVVAVNLLVDMISQGKMAQYVTKNAAPRQVYESKLTQSMTKRRFSNLFKGSGSYVNTKPNTFDALLVDEAHRLREKEMLSSGENQVKELIEASKATVFFVDEDQRVTFQDIGTKREIESWAKAYGCQIHYLDLPSQFRCNGSDGYIAWLDFALGVRDTANRDITRLNYDFQVLDSPKELEEKINYCYDEGYTARLLAGYCWEWVSKDDPDQYDFYNPEHHFYKQWNLTEDGPKWIIKEDSINEIGCIHTAQGLELEYVGVIIGNDLLVRDGKVLVDPSARAKTDKSLSGYKKMFKQDKEKAKALAKQIIKNTYKTLMSRGMKGCYIYCTDEETNDYFKRLAEGELVS
jgi:DUF2075 family protein